MQSKRRTITSLIDLLLACCVAVIAGLGMAQPLAAQAPGRGWATLLHHATSLGRGYALSSVPAATVYHPRVLSGGDLYSLRGDVLSRPAATAIGAQAALRPAAECAGAGTDTVLCVTLDNLGATVLTHHRLIAPALGMDVVVAGLVAAGDTLVLSATVPATLPTLAFDLEVISSSGDDAVDVDAPRLIFPAFAVAVVQPVARDGSVLLLLPLVARP